MRLTTAYLRATRKRKGATPEAAERALSAAKGPAAPPKKFAQRFDIETKTVKGFTIYSIRPGDPLDQTRGSVLYLHGGSHIHQIKPQHWKLIALIVETLGCTVHVPIFGLAPEHHATEAIDLLTEFIDTLDVGEPLHIAGDSSGGGLALAVTLSLPPERRAALAGITLITPLLDVTLTNPKIPAIEPTDPWLNSVGLRIAGAAWAGDLALEDPRVSPINGTFDSMPPVALFIGTRDILWPDCQLLRDRLPANRLIYREAPQMPHAYPLLPAPEGLRGAREVVTNIGGSFTLWG